ncbi:hypothetical protein K501DRAFT_282435 [Backusella circina FSU 941]|nr:hypothetical protein K501DRAFT_282435 [Backusella circina FSU 941]
MTKRTKSVEESEEEIEEYEVESIASHRVLGKTAKRIEYHIKWKGYDSSENTWEPESSVHAEELVHDYWSKHNGIEARDALKRKAGKTTGRKSNPKPTESTATSSKRAKTGAEKSTTTNDNSDSAPTKRRKLTDTASSSTPTKKRIVEKKQAPVVKSEETSKDDDDSEDEEEVHTSKQQKALEKQEDEEEEEEEVDGDEEDDEIDPDDIVRDTDFRKDWDWKTDIEKIIEVQNVEGSEKKNSYRALIKWKDGKYSLHPTEIIRSKCPQQLIDYYESKLVFEKK